MAASNSRVPYDHVCKAFYEWLDERCNAGYGDRPLDERCNAGYGYRPRRNHPCSLERVKNDFQDLLPTFAYFLRQKSGEQEPFADDGITCRTIPNGWDSTGDQRYTSFFVLMDDERIRRIELVDRDFLKIIQKQEWLYQLAVKLVFTGPNKSWIRHGRMILEPGISEAALKKLLDITTNINEDPSMDERQKHDAWVTELDRSFHWDDIEETNGTLPAVSELYSFYFGAFYLYRFEQSRDRLPFGRSFSLLNMIPLIESFYQCFKDGAGRRGPDLVEFVIRRMEEQILHPMNYRLINAFDLVIAYVKAKMEEIELLQRLEFLKHQPERVGYGTNTEDIRELIWQQGRLSPPDWQSAFENLGLSDTFQKLTTIFSKGPYF